MIILMFVCAFALSAAAAVYSIIGLMAIFAAAPVPIAIMGSILEVSKLVVASWLYRNWKEVPFLLKSYLTTALVILMFLTSMGIFGFLSSAHLEQTAPTGDVMAQVAEIDEKINTEREIINDYRKQLNQLDSQVDQLVARTDDAAGVNRANAVRRSQARERTAIAEGIQASQQKIAQLNEQKAPLSSQIRKIEAEVGPIKYIAALIYGESDQKDILEKAVRWVIILIVVVFDPLAVLMLIAANWSLLRANGARAPPQAHTLNVAEEVNVTDLTDLAATVCTKDTVHQNTNINIEVVTPSKEHPVFTPEENVWISRPPPGKHN